jgi:hypothetical protein
MRKERRGVIRLDLWPPKRHKKRMKTIGLSLLGAVLSSLATSGAEYTLHRFKKIQLLNQFWCEGANFGDFNHDGRMDVVSGPYWWAGPDFKVRHEYYPAKQTFNRKTDDGTAENVPGFEGALGKNNAYSDNFFAFAFDFNKDGWDDILIYGFPGKDASWYENPKGQKNADGAEFWKRHKVFDVVDNESPTWADLTGDGKPEIICNSGGYLGYVEPDWEHPEKPWQFHPISPKGPWQRFTHGLGFGDVNGDGKMDMLEAAGWWEQPASLENNPEWTKHAVKFAEGGAQMYAYDVNGDGLNDVITSLRAHGYGLVWHEQVRQDGQITFKQHLIMNREPKENKYGVKFSQLHALDLLDMDGDGLKDIITGKRFWAHGPTGDDDPSAPAVLYWFRLVRGPGGSVDFIPYPIDQDSGVGTQVVAGNINGDKLPDIVVGNKKGTFVFLHQTRQVSRGEWEEAQPKPLAAVTGGIPVKP